MIDGLKTFLKEQFKREVILETREEDTPVSIRIAASDLVRVCKLLYSQEAYYFDLLNCITGVDNGPENATMEVIYNLTSIPYGRSLMLKVQIDREEPVIATVSGIWKTADWLEREIYDLFGIKFENHPDLRRILLPADWEGFPLRKDYEHQEKYHGIRVKY